MKLQLKLIFCSYLKYSIAFLILIILFAQSAEAKVLPQARGSVQKSTSVSVYPKLRADRRALIVNFSNLQNVLALSYSLTYKTSTQDEGAIGSLPMGGSSSATSELLFGTCSKNVCKYHTGIKDAKLEVSYTSKSGKKYLKRYKIKV